MSFPLTIAGFTLLGLGALWAKLRRNENGELSLLDDRKLRQLSRACPLLRVEPLPYHVSYLWASVAKALPDLLVLPRVPVHTFLTFPPLTAKSVKREWHALLEGEQVDCLICDKQLRPIMAIDLFGPEVAISPNAAVKRRALASAGMRLHRCHADTSISPADIFAVLPKAYRPAPEPAVATAS